MKALKNINILRNNFTFILRNESIINISKLSTNVHKKNFHKLTNVELSNKKETVK